MGCEETAGRIAAELLGELSEEERSALEEHLARCDVCRAEAAGQRTVWEELSSLRAPAWDDAARARALAGVRGAVAATAGRTSSRGWLWAASLILAATIGALLPRGRLPWDAPSASRGAAGDDMPQYLLLLTYRPGPPAPEAQRRAVVEEYGRWAASLRQRGRLVSAEKLHDEAGVVVTATGERAYAPVDTAVGGFYLIRAASAAEALTLARAGPHLRYGGTILLFPIDPT